ncbi:hypothetical protein H4Q26_014542 [Puccinia striiformis f. sp. tritici PST-130]|nr:hypothetical protein H4Q26_014542 [Puccinia striiformis f. sp. tritici PST-130]
MAHSGHCALERLRNPRKLMIEMKELDISSTVVETSLKVFPDRSKLKGSSLILFCSIMTAERTIRMIPSLVVNPLSFDILCAVQRLIPFFCEQESVYVPPLFFLLGRPASSQPFRSRRPAVIGPRSSRVRHLRPPGNRQSDLV